MNTPDASILVCTRNRGEDLRTSCLTTMTRLPSRGWELLIVDNGSSDRTSEIAAAIAARWQQVRVITTPRTGLSRARNAAVEAAQGDALLFLDDDAVPSEDWFESLIGALAEEGVAAAGGPVEPVFDGPLPDWLDGRYLPYLSAWDLGPQAQDLYYNEYPRGTNFALTRSAWRSLGPFHSQLGRRGRSLRSCEEIEWCLRAERTGRRVTYVPTARVQHRVAASRLVPNWMVARFAAQGFSEALLEWRHGGGRALAAGLARHRDLCQRGGTDDRLQVACQRAAKTSYTRGAALAPLLVRRWRRTRDGEPARTWQVPR